ncbi:hypothetical protein JI735_16430 [Paenibacillus sonchi]|uniref:Uncharacterized protein n=1 Tax=Paenibacillus sonchi TaxID=373687 RepID=A0A974SET6_9BACL|nr:hypothetical protein [Paenibacillus sonchi]QQZ63868.1 hypothetical protein JI735_16430 [Paenibacillus sonchi]
MNYLHETTEKQIREVLLKGVPIPEGMLEELVERNSLSTDGMMRLKEIMKNPKNDVKSITVTISDEKIDYLEELIKSGHVSNHNEGVELLLSEGIKSFFQSK